MFDWSEKNGDKSGKSHGILISCVSGNPETVQLRLLVYGVLQLALDDRELFLQRFKFPIAVQSRRFVCAVLQLARNTDVVHR